MNRKTIFTIITLLIIVGFMIKLPFRLRNYDKELHALFYFYASFACNLFWAKNRGLQYILGVLALVAFGVGIEIAQEASNHLFRYRIHGQFDIKDIQYNLLGIGLYTTIFIGNTLYHKINS